MIDYGNWLKLRKTDKRMFDRILFISEMARVHFHLNFRRALGRSNVAQRIGPGGRSKDDKHVVTFLCHHHRHQGLILKPTAWAAGASGDFIF
jgi:hypothetical protein